MVSRELLLHQSEMDINPCLKKALITGMVYYLVELFERIQVLLIVVVCFCFIIVVRPNSFIFGVSKLVQSLIVRIRCELRLIPFSKCLQVNRRVDNDISTFNASHHCLEILKQPKLLESVSTVLEGVLKLHPDLGSMRVELIEESET